MQNIFFFKFVWKFTIGVDFCSQSNNIDFFVQFRLVESG